MPSGTRPQLGNFVWDGAIYVASVTYPTLGANASGTNTATVPGLQTGDFVFGQNMISPPAHLSLDNVYVSAPNTLTITWFTNGTGISTGSVACVFEICRSENGELGNSFLPPNML